MNKDLDERLIPKGEYREAQNVNIIESESSDASAIENIKGNVAKNVLASISGSPEVIGFVSDVKNKKIYYFVTNFSGSVNFNDNIRNITRSTSAVCKIIQYDTSTQQNTVILEGSFLNLSKNHLITGAQVIDDLLFFTDDYNQPRRINVFKCLEHFGLTGSSDYYTTEDEISIAKYAPYTPIRLVNANGVWANDNSASSNVAADKTDGNIKSDYLRENFVRFSYRYKYEDGEYSLFAPFTQIVFEPLNNGEIKTQDGQRNTTTNEPDVAISSQDVLKKTKVDLMQNAINKVILRIPVPNVDERGNTSGSFPNGYTNPYKISEVQIVLKEADSRAIKVVKNIKIRDSVDRNNQTFESYSIKPKTNTTSTGSTSGSSTTVTLTQANNAIKVGQGVTGSGVAAGTTVSAIDGVTLTLSAAANLSNVTLTFVPPTFYRQVLKHIYRSEKPFQVLPEDQTTRVYDQVPLLAKSLEVVGNRVVFGNYVENYKFPKDQAGKKGMNYFVGLSTAKSDVEHNKTFGLLQNTYNAYRHHNIKQRRTYQVGIVFADKFGRQSPVVLSSHNGNITDTFTVGPDVEDKKHKFDSDSNGSGDTYSWSSNRVAYGQALQIDFQDPVLFENVKDLYNGDKTSADYNPHGWYSYRIVVKQTEQEYYNVYGNYAANSWSNVGTTETRFDDNGQQSATGVNSQIIDGKQDLTAGGRSWFTLYGDNINKVPRNPSEQDFTREGISGSDTTLYPKVIPQDGAGKSKMGSVDQEPVDVISIGTATEQGLFSDNPIIKPATLSLANKPRIYNFVYGKDRNPLVAELPNLKVEPVGIDNIDIDVTTSNSNTTDTPIGYPTDGNVGITENPQFGSEGLMVFETKPFESKIDIFYESGTCGLVQDLDDQLEATSNAANPDEIEIDPANGQFAESTAIGGTVVTVSATDNTGSSNLSFAIQSASTGNGQDVSSKFNIDSSSGVVTLAGGFRRTDTTADTITLNVAVSDPDAGTAYSAKTLTVTNSAPTSTGPSSVNIPNNAGTNYTVATFTIKNGSTITSEDHIGLSVTHALGNTNFNNYFNTSISGNTLTVKTTGQWTVSNANAFFGNSSANRTITITIDDGLNANNTATDTVTVNQQTTSVSGTLHISDNSAVCDFCGATQGTFYAVASSGTTPTVVNGELRVHTGNQIYTNVGLTNNASAGDYFYENDSAQYPDEAYYCVSVNSSGQVTAVNETSECSDGSE